MAKVVVVSVGDRINRWEVISDIFYKTFPSGSKAKFVTCRCDCGSVSDVRLGALTNKRNPSLSCGCVRLESMVKLRKPSTIGERFNRLTVVSEMTRRGGRSYVNVECDCGAPMFEVRMDQLKSGNTGSCGCLQKDAVRNSTHERTGTPAHGMCGTTAYSSWQGMKDRCSNPNNPRYDRYGARGISFPDKWKLFLGFWEDMSDGWYEGADIDRIDFNLSYSKDNCRWVDRDIGNHNKGKSKGTSDFKGVYYDKARGKWVARLSRNGRTFLQKRFDCEYEAALAYDNKSEEIYGDRPNKTLREDNIP